MTNPNEAEALSVLRAVTEIPTAPLHEARVGAYVNAYLQQLGLTPRADAYGNITVEYRRGESPRPVALVAHLDHPALEITSIEGPGRARAVLLGGVPAACFDRTIPIRVISDQGESEGTVVGYEAALNAGGPLTLRLQTDGPVQVGDFAVFDLPAFRQEDNLISLAVADDLAGVAAALLTLKNLVTAGPEGVVYGVFTRAEEIGLVGATLVAEEGRLSPETIVVSLECSRALPGAEPGQGPVIRVGDRTRSFSPEGEALLLQARDALPTLPVQRQLMSGGTCEATAFGVKGYRATGVALPLSNYHNVGPRNVIAPEQIDFRDFLGEIALLTAAAEAAPNPRPGNAEERLARQAAAFRQRLMDTSGRFRDGDQTGRSDTLCRSFTFGRHL